MNFHEHVSHWESFYLLVGTAGATLAGLTFVAVTAAEQVVRIRQNVTTLRNRIDPALLAFTLALLLGCVLLMPTLTPLALGLTLAGCGLYSFGYNLFVMLQFDWNMIRKHYDRLDWLFTIVLPLLTGLGLILAGWQCWSGAVEVGLTVAGVASLTLLLMAIRNALDMLMVTLHFTASTDKKASPDEIG